MNNEKLKHFKEGLNQFAKAVVFGSLNELKKQKKGNSKLARSIMYKDHVMQNSIALDFIMNDYGIFHDKGVKGKTPNALSKYANYYGVHYEEALCCGLGSGMGFFYTKNKEGKPSEVIHLRAPNMEPNFFSNSNLKYEWIKESDFNIAENKLIQDIKNGFPVFLQTDIYFLHYYNSPIHFP